MRETGCGLRKLCEGLGLSQAKRGELAGMTQSTVDRCETGYSAAPLKTLPWYADEFDVSRDDLCGRTDKPQDRLYEFKFAKERGGVVCGCVIKSERIGTN